MFALPLTFECLAVRDQAFTEDGKRAGRPKPHTHTHNSDLYNGWTRGSPVDSCSCDHMITSSHLRFLMSNPLWVGAPGAPGERKGSANKLSPGPGLRFQPSVRCGWGAMGTRSARGPVSIRSSGSTQWGPACRQHR